MGPLLSCLDPRVEIRKIQTASSHAKLNGASSIFPDSSPPTTSISFPNHKVFISHAGEDKSTIALPLRNKLLQHGITAFVDEKDMPGGTWSEHAMITAMEYADVAVVVLSPEFVSRKWPVRELLCFLRRSERPGADGRTRPVIVPLFYRLTIQQLYEEPKLDRLDENGQSLYQSSRFFERMKNGEPEANIDNIKTALRKLHGVMGVENYVDASNDSNNTMFKRRDVLLNDVCDHVRNALRRISEANRHTKSSSSVYKYHEPYALSKTLLSVPVDNNWRTSTLQNPVTGQPVADISFNDNNGRIRIRKTGSVVRITSPTLEPEWKITSKGLFQGEAKYVKFLGGIIGLHIGIQKLLLVPIDTSRNRFVLTEVEKRGKPVDHIKLMEIRRTGATGESYEVQFVHVAWMEAVALMIWLCTALRRYEESNEYKQPQVLSKTLSAVRVDNNSRNAILQDPVTGQPVADIIFHDNNGEIRIRNTGKVVHVMRPTVKLVWYMDIRSAQWVARYIKVGEGRIFLDTGILKLWIAPSDASRNEFGVTEVEKSWGPVSRNRLMEIRRISAMRESFEVRFVDTGWANTGLEEFVGLVLFLCITIRGYEETYLSKFGDEGPTDDILL